MPRLVGIDLGARRIGVALSDPGGTTATPYAVIDRLECDDDVGAVADVVRREVAAKIVVGLPLRLDGTRGEAAEAAEAFAGRLRAAGLEVVLWDERLTTVEADRRLRDTGASGRRRRKIVDKVAAAVLLQSYLDAKR